MGKLGKIAGIMELISVFIPILLISAYYDTFILIFYWIGGLILVSGCGTYVLFIFDIIGTVIALLILVIGILCITREGKILLISGIITIILMIFYLIWFYNILADTVNLYGVTNKILINPFIGFFSIMMSGILATIGGFRSR